MVAVTLARMKLPQVPRFIRWGWPVEQLVRDHPSTTPAIAAIRLPGTQSPRFQCGPPNGKWSKWSVGVVPCLDPSVTLMQWLSVSRKDFHFELYDASVQADCRIWGLGRAYRYRSLIESLDGTSRSGVGRPVADCNNGIKWFS